jgi:hypothetical protein
MGDLFGGRDVCEWQGVIQTYSNHLQQMAGVKMVDSSIHLIFAIHSLGMPDVEPSKLYEKTN